MSFPANVIPVFGSQRAYADLNFAGGSFGLNGGVVNNPALLSGWTFTRASTAWGFGSNGYLQSFSSGTPRFVYDPVTLASLGIRVEEARTNLCLQSQTFDNASWTKTNSVVTANAVTSPDGTTNADAMVDDTTNADHKVRQSISVTNGTVYTLSVYAKANTLNYIWLLAGTPNVGKVFNLATGAVAGNVGGAPTSAEITAGGHGWYRCSITYTAGATSAQNQDIGLSPNGTTFNYVGSGQGVYLWQSDFQAGTGVSSPIVTTSAAVTRAADVPYNSGLATLPEFTVVAEGIPNSPDTMPAVQTIAGYDDGTATNRVYAFRSTNSATNLATSTGYTYNGANWPQGASRKVALTSRTGAQTGAFNGTLASPGTSAQPTGLSSLSIGIRSDRSTLQWNGTISRIRIYNRALSDAQLQALTA